MVNQSKTQILDMTIPQKMGHFQAILIAMIGHLIKHDWAPDKNGQLRRGGARPISPGE